ncbi:MAG: four-carbon acid sugar kinase family protein, partial [Burkholderiales bacterium]|nr:four-carbon acid sugar kinase family protein [Anaerolineae bacterium]
GILDERPTLPRLGPVDQLLVLSGSCSPVTERQIDAALAAGFAEIALEPEALLAEDSAAEARQSAINNALELLGTGRSVIVHSARGPQDPRIAATNRQLERMGYDEQAIKLSSGSLLGAKLGSIARSILEQRRLQRVVLSGGDTSSYVMRALGIEAVEVKAPFATAMPFCHAYAPGSPADGLEMIFKGGQTGSITFFNDVQQDTP